MFALASTSVVCGDLKVGALLLGHQGGYTKNCVFLCQWDSSERNDHCIKKNVSSQAVISAWQ